MQMTTFAILTQLEKWKFLFLPALQRYFSTCNHTILLFLYHNRNILLLFFYSIIFLGHQREWIEVGTLWFTICNSSIVYLPWPELNSCSSTQHVQWQKMCWSGSSTWQGVDIRKHLFHVPLRRTADVFFFSVRDADRFCYYLLLLLLPLLLPLLLSLPLSLSLRLFPEPGRHGNGRLIFLVFLQLFLVSRWVSPGLWSTKRDQINTVSIVLWCRRLTVKVHQVLAWVISDQIYTHLMQRLMMLFKIKVTESYLCILVKIILGMYFYFITLFLPALCLL